MGERILLPSSLAAAVAAAAALCIWENNSRLSRRNSLSPSPVSSSEGPLARFNGATRPGVALAARPGVFFLL